MGGEILGLLAWLLGGWTLAAAYGAGLLDDDCCGGDDDG